MITWASHTHHPRPLDLRPGLERLEAPPGDDERGGADTSATPTSLAPDGDPPGCCESSDGAALLAVEDDEGRRGRAPLAERLGGLLVFGSSKAPASSTAMLSRAA